MPIRFTVVAPSFNQAAHVSQTIESVLSQEGNFEIEYSVMHGGSTDGSAEISREYTEKVAAKRSPALFSIYDQFLIVSRVELSPHADPPALANSPAQRMVQALLDIESRAKSTERRLLQSEADRAARLKVIEAQSRWSGQLEGESAALTQRLVELRRNVEASEQDRAARPIDYRGPESTRGADSKANVTPYWISFRRFAKSSRQMSGTGMPGGSRLKNTEHKSPSCR